MSGPGLWADVGKRTNDLLYKDFSADQRFTVTTTTSTGLTFSTVGSKKGDAFDGDFVTTFKRNNATVDVKVNTDSKIFSTIKWEEIAPGTKAILHFSLPDQKSGKLEVQFANQFIGVTSTVGLNSSPVVECTGVGGMNDVVFGGETAFDATTGKLSKYNVGVGLNKPDFSAALFLVDKADTVKASYSHVVNPFGKTVVGAEMTHKLSTKQNTFSVGGMYALDPLTTLKARVNNHGKVGAVIQHEWRPKSVISVSAEVDAKALDKNAKVGLALVLKP